jgi:hypothetical protein
MPDAKDLAAMLALLFGPLLAGIPLVAVLQIFFAIVGPPG